MLCLASSDDNYGFAFRYSCSSRSCTMKMVLSTAMALSVKPASSFSFVFGGNRSIFGMYRSKTARCRAISFASGSDDASIISADSMYFSAVFKYLWSSMDAGDVIVECELSGCSLFRKNRQVWSRW